MPNLFAYFMLCAWPLIGIWLYKRFDTVAATFWTIVGGFLFLPVKTQIDFPLIPAFDKESIPGITAFLCIVFIKKRKISLLPTNTAAKILVILISVTPLLTVLNNSEPVFNGQYWIQGMSLYDSISVILRQYILLIPFIIACHVIKSDNDLVKICRLFVISALIYSPLILWEVRMSPQLHTDIYGFFPHSFAQQVRFGGYRPMAFLGHGLLVGIYIMAAFAISCALWNRKYEILNGIPNSIIVFFLLFILLVCKTSAAFLFGLSVLALVLLNIKFVIDYAVKLLIFIVILYPSLCLMQLFPHQELVELFSAIDDDRARSLDFRFYHEALMLEHAQNKFWTGWGSWGRNRLAESITDSYWIIVFGQYGVIGFYGIFGLACTCLIGRSVKSKFHNILALGLCFILIDQLINSSIAAWFWILVGAIYSSSGKMRRVNSNLANNKPSYPI